MFGVSTTPIIREHKTVTTASGTGHIFCAATSLQRDQVRTCMVQFCVILMVGVVDT